MVIGMKNFFTFYTDINDMAMPFLSFSLVHIAFLLISIFLIATFYRRYCHMDAIKQRQFQKGMAIYFLLEEAIYTLWLLLFCHDHTWIQILSLIHI